jgi:hypothetical protein
VFCYRAAAADKVVGFPRCKQVSWILLCQLRKAPNQVASGLVLTRFCLDLQDAEAWATGYPTGDLGKWFDRVQSAAVDLGPLCRTRKLLGSLVPYPLWGGGLEALKVLEPNGRRLVYTASRRQGEEEEKMVIKLTTGRYPEEVRNCDFPLQHEILTTQKPLATDCLWHTSI